MKKYTAKAGEMWDLLAYNLYGSEMRASDLMAANPQLTDIIIFEGDEILNIPEDIETADNSTLAPWRR